MLLVAALVVGVRMHLVADDDEAVATVEANARGLVRVQEEHVFQVLRRLDQALVHLRSDYGREPSRFIETARRWQNTLYGDLAIQVAVIGADGQLVMSNLQRPQALVDLGDREHFQVHRLANGRDEVFVSVPVVGRVSGQTTIQITRALLDDNGGFQGVMVLSVAPEVLLGPDVRADLGSRGVLRLLGSDGKVRVRVDAERAAIVDATSEAGSSDPALWPAPGVTRITYAGPQKDQLVAARRVRDYPLLVDVRLVMAEQMADYAQWRRHLDLGSVVVGGFVLLVGIVIALLSHREGRHLRALTELEGEMRAAEERWRLGLEAVGDGVWDWDIASGTVFFSRNWRTLLRLPHDPAQDRLSDWHSRIHPDDQATVQASLDDHLQGSAPVYANEHRIQLADGSVRWVLDRGLVVKRSVTGAPLRMIGNHTDITDLRATEQALRTTAARLEAVLTAAPIGICIADGQRCLQVINPQLAEYLGRPVDSVVGTHPAPYYADQDESDAVERDLYPVIAAGGTAQRVVRFRRANGSIFWARLVGRRVSGSEPEWGTIWLIDDITAARKAEQALQERQQLFERMFAANSAIKLLIDPATGEIVDANPAAAEFYGDTLDGLRRRVYGQLVEATTAAESAGIRAERHRLSDGSLRDVEVHAASLEVAGRSLDLLLIHDVTARRQAETALEIKTRDLERSNAELEAFAYVASHDLRQPLRTITGYLGLLVRDLGTDLSPDIAEYVGFCQDGARRMDRLIVDLLDYSRVGRKSQPFALLSLSAVIETAEANLAAAVAEAGATVVYSPTLPDVWGSESELVRLVQNLLANAILYRSPERAAVIQIIADQQDHQLTVSIIDNGIGIPPEHRERVFGLFQRLHHREEGSGTGIGLAICRKIVEHHGGRIWMAETEGGGCTVHFTLARPRAAS